MSCLYQEIALAAIYQKNGIDAYKRQCRAFLKEVKRFFQKRQHISRAARDMHIKSFFYSHDADVMTIYVRYKGVDTPARFTRIRGRIMGAAPAVMPAPCIKFLKDLLAYYIPAVDGGICTMPDWRRRVPALLD